MKTNVLSALLASVVVFAACGQTKSVRLSTIDGARRSDDLVTVTVTLASNGHLALEPSDPACVSVEWRAGGDEDVSDAGVSDAGVVDAGTVDGGAADAGVVDSGTTDGGATDGRVTAGALLDTVSGCTTSGKGLIIELTSSRPIPRPATVTVTVTTGFGLGRLEDRQRTLPSW